MAQPAWNEGPELHKGVHCRCPTRQPSPRLVRAGSWRGELSPRPFLAEALLAVGPRVPAAPSSSETDVTCPSI